MSDIIQTVHSYLYYYIGDGWYFYYFLFSLGILFNYIHNASIMFLYKYIFIILFIVFFPPTAYILMKYCIGEDVYWRMFWLIPTTLTIALSCVLIITKFSIGKSQILVFIISIFLLIAGGNYIYVPDLFQKAPNSYKLPAAIVPLCDYIDANTPPDERRVAAAPELVSYIRQYDASITMPYGREAVYWNDGFDNDYAYSLFQIISDSSYTAKDLNDLAISARCNYIILPTTDTKNNEMKQTDYTALIEIHNYVIYYNKNVYVN